MAFSHLPFMNGRRSGHQALVDRSHILNTTRLLPLSSGRFDMQPWMDTAI